MDPELERYLGAVVLLLGLIVGFQATELLVSAEGMSASFLLVPLTIGVIAAAGAMAVAERLER